MKKKIAILLSAMMVASAMPFSATAAELKGDTVLNAAFPKTDKTIDPAAPNYKVGDGEDLSIEQIKSRQSALSLNFDNNSKSGGIEKNATFKIKLEGGTFDTDILNRYQYVNTINGKSVSYNTAIGYDSNSGTYTAETLTDVFTNIANVNNNKYGWVENESGKIENRVLADTSTQGDSIVNHIKNTIDVVTKAQTTKQKITVNGQDRYVDTSSGVTGFKITSDEAGSTAVVVDGVTFNGSSELNSEAQFLALVDAINGTTYTTDYSSNKTVSAIVKDELNAQFGASTSMLPHIPYKLEIDNDTTATITIPVSISDDEAKKVIIDKSAVKQITSAGTTVGVSSDGSSTLNSWNRTDILGITQIKGDTPTYADATNNAEFADPYMVLPLGAVVADGEAPVKVTVDGSYTDKVKTSTHTITKGDVSGSTSIVYPESSIKRFEDDTTLNPVVLKENARGTIGKNITNNNQTNTTDIFLRLSGGFKFKFNTSEVNTEGKINNPLDYIKDDSNNIEGWGTTTTVEAELINNSTIKFTITDLENKNTRDKAIGFRFENLDVEPINKDNYGDVTLNISGDGINSASTVVAKREALGFKLTTLQDPETIVVGRHYVANNYTMTSTKADGAEAGGKASGTMLEKDNTTVEIKFSEAVPNTLVESRVVNFTVPEGVKIVDAEIYDAKNVNNTFGENLFEITNNGRTLELQKGEYVAQQSNQRNKVVEFKMKLDLSVDPAYDKEDITLGVTGGGQSETVETVIAKAKKPFEVTTSTTKANMGYQTYETANITITETAPGMFLENKEVELSLVAPYGTQELGFSNATLKVDGEELKVDDKSFKVGSKDKNSESVITFTIDKASHKTANSITIENVKVGTTRSIPYGSYALGISGDAIINNYTDYVKDNEDFALTTITAKADKKEPNLVMQSNTSRFEVANYLDIITETGTFDDVVRVTIGEKTVLIGDKAVDMDVAPYIQASSNSTMVPLRFVSVALGVDSASIDNPDASNKIAWDANTKTTTIYYGEGTGQKIIQFQAGSNIMTVDGTRIPMEYGVKAEIKDGRMFVPFRALGQALGINVQWDPDTRTAIYNADKVANTAVATTTATESTTESTTASTTTESTTASDSTTETTTAKQ